MGGANLWSSGFLPTTYQGVEFLRSADPIPNLSSPNGISMKRQTARFGRGPRLEPGAVGGGR